MPDDALVAPVLLTGRGGSGTRLLSQIAGDAGIFLGNKINDSGDSIEWVELIFRMAAAEGGGLDLPSGSWWRREIRAKARRILYLAPLRQSPLLWGLKLPEAMLVLPLLIDAFPQAKVMHLTRHPVSSSLRRGHLTVQADQPGGRRRAPGGLSLFAARCRAHGDR